MLKHGTGDGGEILLLDSGLVFEAALKGDARRKRDAAIPDTAAFDADPRLAVTMRWRDIEAWFIRHEGAWVELCRKPDDADD